MDRVIREAKIRQLLTGQRQFGKITITDNQVDSEGLEHPIMVSEHEFYNPQSIEDIEVYIIYQSWQIAT